MREYDPPEGLRYTSYPPAPATAVQLIFTRVEPVRTAATEAGAAGTGLTLAAFVSLP